MESINKKISVRSVFQIGVRSVIFLYLIIFLLLQVLVDKNTIEKGVMGRALNEIKPSSYEYLIKLSQGKASFDKNKIEKYAYYYKKVIRYQPKMGSAYGMLGFCYFHLGKHNEAVSSYIKALEINPYFFWFHYNLGLVYFKNSQYEQAALSFEKAKKAVPEHTLKFIRASKVIYAPIVRENLEKFGKAMRGQLMNGYRDSQILLTLSYYHLKKYEGVLNEVSYALKSELERKEVFYYYAALALYKLKRYDHAAFFLKKSIKIEPRHTEAFHYLGLILRELGKQEAALMALKQAKILHETNGSFIKKIERIGLEVF